MGLLNEISNVNRTLQNNQQKELTKAEKKELKQIRKQKLLILLKRNINELFEEVENQKDVDELTRELLKHKKQNISIIKEQYFEKYDVKLSINDLNYLDEIYFKTISSIQKEYTIIFKQEERERKEEERQKEIAERAAQKEYIQKQKEKQIAYNNIITLLKTITIILLSPFLLIGFVLIGIMKNIK